MQIYWEIIEEKYINKLMTTKYYKKYINKLMNTKY